MSDVTQMALPAPAVLPPVATTKWQRERIAFSRLKPELLETYRGEYVAIHEGQVVDHGPDDVALALRFFAKYGNVPVHIGLVTDSPEAAERIPHYLEAARSSGP
jgi:hypothetical protein